MPVCPSARRPAWLPAVVLVLAAGGTWVAAQPPGMGRGIPQPPTIPQPPVFPQPPATPQPPNFGPPAIPQPPAMPQPPAVTPPQFGPAGGIPGMGNDGMVEVWTCQKCKHEWPKSGGPTPTKCPKCGVQFTHIVNPDGTQTRTSAGTFKLIGGGIVLLVAIAAGIYRLTKSSAGTPVKRKKKPKRIEEEDDEDDERPRKRNLRDDDEDDEDERPRKRSRRDDNEYDDDERPRKRNRRDDEYDDDERPRRRR